MEDQLNNKINFEEGEKKGLRARLKMRLSGVKERLPLGFLRRVPRPGKKGIGIGLAVLLLLALFFVLGIAWPLWGMYGKAKTLKLAGTRTYDAVKAQDLPGIKQGLADTKKELASLESSYRFLGWSRFIPFFGNYYQDGRHSLRAASASLEGAEIFVVTLEPYADILGFTGAEASPEGETAQGRIEFVLETIDKVSPQLDQIGEKLAIARDEINQVNPNRYPKQLGQMKIRDNVELVIDSINQAAVVINDARPLFRVLPQLAGVGEEKKYLLIFQNDLELRPTGGFITAYAVLRVRDGQVTPAGSFDI